MTILIYFLTIVFGIVCFVIMKKALRAARLQCLFCILRLHMGAKTGILREYNFVLLQKGGSPDEG